MMRSPSRPLAALGLLLIVASAAAAALARDPFTATALSLSDPARDPGVLHGRAIGAVAKVDTIYLLGGPDRLDGKFQDAAGQPDWQGWTSHDLSYAPEAEWSVTADPALVIGGARSLWCGIVYPEPGPIPVPGFGYGNDWVCRIVSSHTVADPGQSSIVTWAMLLQHDTEPVYDTIALQWNRAGSWTTLVTYDGFCAEPVLVAQTFTVEPSDLVGPQGNEIQLRIEFVSDRMWSDQDGLWPTSRGACQVDDIAVTIGGALVSFTDFEDGAMGDWVPVANTGVGDFAALYQGLFDLDPCAGNASPQVAFVDDGVVVPGTGGSECISWCYGPFGYIVNNSGGLLGSGHVINNMIQSPALAWPSQVDGAYLAFDVYRHEELGDPEVWPGVFYQWHVRSTSGGDPAGLAAESWRSRNLLYYGGPEYWRQREDLSDLLVGGRTHVQVSLRVIQLGWDSGWWGPDGTPAPYFDNVAVVAYAMQGPVIAARTVDLAQDGFPATPQIDDQDLAANAVRFDMARNIAPAEHLINRPGDSLIVDVRSLRAGIEVAWPPAMHVSMRANPVFDGVRTLPAGFIRVGNVVTGMVDGQDTYHNGFLIPGRYHFDLPDDDFFFPGDVLHYHFRAEDTAGGVATLPGDLTGFGVHGDHLAWPSPFAIRGLPSMESASPGDQPRILFWNDGGSAGLDKWVFALRHAGYVDNRDYDLYQTTAAVAGVGNGLGGRASLAHLEHYRTIIYRCGDLSTRTLSNGDPDHDPGDDLGLFDAWLGAPGHLRRALLTGDNLVASLQNVGSAGQTFVSTWLGVTFQGPDVRPFINNQAFPVVRAVDGNGIFWRLPRWTVSGGCPRFKTFDTLIADGAQRLAEFTTPHGQHGVYPYAAATRHVHPEHQTIVVLLPYDLAAIDPPPGYVPPSWAVGKAVRSVILEDVLESFGHGYYLPTAVPVAASFGARCFPNPFNPSTTIRLQVPAAGDVSVAVYNVRGELVHTLLDGALEAGPHDVLWDGRDAAGALAASGVYFFQARHGQEVKVGKMLLMK